MSVRRPAPICPSLQVRQLQQLNNLLSEDKAALVQEVTDSAALTTSLQEQVSIFLCVSVVEPPRSQHGVAGHVGLK